MGRFTIVGLLATFLSLLIGVRVIQANDALPLLLTDRAMKVSDAGPTPGLTIPVVRERPPVPDPDSQPVRPAVQTPEVPKYECPKTRYINCMPPVQEIDRPMCTKEYLDWAKRHCTGFEVVY